MDSGEVEKIRNELDLVYRKVFRVVFIVGSGLAAAATLIVLFSIPHVPQGRKEKCRRRAQMTGSQPISDEEEFSFGLYIIGFSYAKEKKGSQLLKRSISPSLALM